MIERDACILYALHVYQHTFDICDLAPLTESLWREYQNFDIFAPYSKWMSPQSAWFSHAGAHNEY